jgi:hypothetical protein
MSDTIYWAIKLDEHSKTLLLSKIPPIHTNIFAEHMTVAFRPSDFVEKSLMARLGEQVMLTVMGIAYDDKGQAAIVDSQSVKRTDNGDAHITISCASGVKPVYSNTLVSRGWVPIAAFAISGTIARFTKNGWETQ